MVVLADIPGDMEATVTSVLDGLDLLDDHPCDAEPILPLQPPHDDCYRELEGLADRYAIGGVVNSSTREQVEAARAVRNASGSDIWLHGLGYGLETPRNRYGPKSLVYTLNEHPTLLDSLDYSTPAQRALNQPHTAGQHRSLPIAAYSGYVLLEVARLLSPATDLTSQTVHSPLSW